MQGAGGGGDGDGDAPVAGVALIQHRVDVIGGCVDQPRVFSLKLLVLVLGALVRSRGRRR